MDVGELALEEIHKLLLIDEAWTWRRPRGFSWIAHRLEHRRKSGLRKPWDRDFPHRLESDGHRQCGGATERCREAGRRG